MWGTRGWECGVGGGSLYPAVQTPLARGLKRSSPEPRGPSEVGWARARPPSAAPSFCRLLLEAGNHGGGHVSFFRSGAREPRMGPALGPQVGAAQSGRQAVGGLPA